MSRRHAELFGARQPREDLEAAENDGFLSAVNNVRAQDDEHLNAISQSINRVKNAAQGFGEELRRQNEGLDAIGQDMERTNNAMKAIEGKTAQLVESAGGPGWFCLTASLSAIAFFLFLLIIYT